jgi:hypothetical protein
MVYTTPGYLISIFLLATIFLLKFSVKLWLKKRLIDCTAICVVSLFFGYLTIEMIPEKLIVTEEFIAIEAGFIFPSKSIAVTFAEVEKIVVPKKPWICGQEGWEIWTVYYKGGEKEDISLTTVWQSYSKRISRQIEQYGVQIEEHI